MTTEPDIEYRCDPCGLVEYRRYLKPEHGGSDGSARAAGWRIGASPAKARNVICPACAGTDPDYWDRQVLAMARQAGIA